MSFLARRRDRPAPSAASQRKYDAVSVPHDTLTTIGTVYGSGYCEWSEWQMTHSSFCMYVYCDDVLAFREHVATLSAFGHTPSTPVISLLSYVVDGTCVAQIALRFEFRQKLEFKADQISGFAKVVTLASLVNLV